MVDARRKLIETSNKINVAGMEWKRQKTNIICGNRKGTKERAFASIQAVVAKKNWGNEIKIRKCNDLPHYFTSKDRL